MDPKKEIELELEIVPTETEESKLEKARQEFIRIAIYHAEPEPKEHTLN